MQLELKSKVKHNNETIKMKRKAFLRILNFLEVCKLLVQSELQKEIHFLFSLVYFLLS